MKNKRRIFNSKKSSCSYFQSNSISYCSDHLVQHLALRPKSMRGFGTILGPPFLIQCFRLACESCEHSSYKYAFVPQHTTGISATAFTAIYYRPLSLSPGRDKSRAFRFSVCLPQKNNTHPGFKGRLHSDCPQGRFYPQRGQQVDLH